MSSAKPVLGVPESGARRPRPGGFRGTRRVGMPGNLNGEGDWSGGAWRSWPAGKGVVMWGAAGRGRDCSWPHHRPRPSVRGPGSRSGAEGREQVGLGLGRLPDRIEARRSPAGSAVAGPGAAWRGRSGWLRRAVRACRPSPSGGRSGPRCGRRAGWPGSTSPSPAGPGRPSAAGSAAGPRRRAGSSAWRWRTRGLPELMIGTWVI